MLVHDLLQQSLHFALPVLGAPTALDRMARDPFPLTLGQSKRVLHRAVIVQHIAAKVGRIVAVDAELDAVVQVGADGQVGHGLDAAQLDVGQRTHGHHDVAVGELPQHGHVVSKLDAVVNARDVQVVQRRRHEVDAGLLARVRRAPEPARRRVVVDGLVLVRRVAQLRARQAQPAHHAGLQVRDRRLVHVHAVLHGQVPQHAHDQLAGEAQLGGRLLLRGRKPGDDGLVADPARRVRLRVEEHLGVHDAVGRRARKVRRRQRLKVRRRHQHRHADEVVVQEVVQRREASVARQQRVDRGEGRVRLGRWE